MSLLVPSIIVAVSCILLKLVLSAWMSSNRIWSALKKVPGPKAHLLNGNLDIIGSIDDYLPSVKKLCEQYPKMFPLWYGPTNPVLMVSDPVIAREFNKSANTKETHAHRFLREWTGPGLLYSNGELWARNRKLLTPGFHFDVLKPYMIVYNECTDILLEKWVNHAEQGKPFEVLEDFCLLAFDIIVQCACSTQLNPQTHGSKHPFLAASRENTALVEARLYNPLFSNSFIYGLSSSGKKFYSNVAYSRQFAKEIVLQRKAALENQDNINESRKHLDFLDIMLTAQDSEGVGMSVDEIVYQVISFLYAGHDTTSSSLSWLMFSLACNPECQKKCREEVDNVLGSRTDLVWEDLAKLKYLTLCIKESQRLHTTVPILAYTLGEDTTVEGYTFPKGMDIEFPSYVFHHDLKWYKDPDKFNPERFTAENSKGRDPYAYIPFAIGARNCIGQNFALQELKAVSAKIIQRFEIFTNDTSYHHIPSVILKNKGGIWLSLKERR
ncbi:Cytochrome P450 4B1 [Trichoplax sp. H2]|nr:Cytochrome P450 4B1 [Trichoplax sp. H2]|eukprot:RDD36217.1 Cytochrome P450 4B1 [Trichoplax sp. H2]